MEARHRHEEPFALAAVGGVLATVASLRSEPLASLGSLYLGGLERLLRLANSPYGSGLGNGSNEPVPLVVAAQELLLLVAVTYEEQ
ncbi:MAG: hypothetical protein ACXWPK_08160 [Isosphaeraceae bacterium]